VPIFFCFFLSAPKIFYLHLRYRERSGVATAATGLVFGCLLLTLPMYVFALPAFLFLIKRRAGILRATLVASLAILLAGLWSFASFADFSQSSLWGLKRATNC
jgi:hypothetical protein